jgi:ATP-binding cassette, subfamily B (MDR/TAP), member 1
MNAPEWPYSIMGAVGSVLSGFIGPTFAIVMSNMIDVFYYRNYASMEKKTKEYVFIYTGAGRMMLAGNDLFSSLININY